MVDGQPPWIDDRSLNADETEYLTLGLTRVADEPIAALFRRAVDLNLYPSYSDLVPLPMDLGLILSRLESGYYRRVDAVGRDIEQILVDCKLFNDEPSDIVDDCRYVEASAQDKVQRALNRVNLGPLIRQEQKELQRLHQQLEDEEAWVDDDEEEGSVRQMQRSSRASRHKRVNYAEMEEDEFDEEDEEGGGLRSRTSRRGRSIKVPEKYSDDVVEMPSTRRRGVEEAFPRITSSGRVSRRPELYEPEVMEERPVGGRGRAVMSESDGEEVVVMPTFTQSGRVCRKRQFYEPDVPQQRHTTRQHKGHKPPHHGGGRNGEEEAEAQQQEVEGHGTPTLTLSGRVSKRPEIYDPVIPEPKPSKKKSHRRIEEEFEEEEEEEEEEVIPSYTHSGRLIKRPEKFSSTVVHSVTGAKHSSGLTADQRFAQSKRPSVLSSKVSTI